MDEGSNRMADETARAAMTTDVVRFLRELFRLVRTDQSDFETAKALGAAAEENPEDALIALQWLTEVRNVVSPSYETDRARRVLTAAISRTPPEPASSKDAVLFEREQELARMPQEQAFAELVSAVPELDLFGSRAKQLADAPASFGISLEANGVNVPPDLLPNTARLVGPGSNHPDPLVKSHVAASIVSNYVVAVITGTTHLALWDESAPMRAGSLTGTLAE